MNKDNNGILKAKVGKNESKLLTKIEEYYEGFYLLFYLILKDPLDNFWWECISITIQYSQILVLVVNDTVS